MRVRSLALAGLAAASVLTGSVLLASRPTSASPSRQTLRGTVITVYDGDTVKVRLSGGADEKVRLIGVDSPELEDARERVRLWAFLAKRFAYSRLYQAGVELLPGPEERDAFGRLLAFVRTPDGRLFNVTLVREGFAHAYLRFPFDEALRAEIKAAEAEARQAGRGLWGAEPWPVIGPGQAGPCVGEVLTVRFRCSRVYKRGSFRLLEADGAAFDAAVTSDVFRTLPGPLDFGGRTLEVTGLVELYKGRPQILIGLPVQLKRLD